MASWRPSLPAPRALRIGLLASSAAVVIGYAMYNVTGYTQRQWLNIPMSAGTMLRPIVLSVRANVDTAETVAVSAEAAAYFYSGRVSVPVYSYEVEHFFRPPTVDEEARALDAITAAYDVDVILASTKLQQQAMRAPRPGRAIFKLRDSTSAGLVFVRSGS